MEYCRPNRSNLGHLRTKDRGGPFPLLARLCALPWNTQDTCTTRQAVHRSPVASACAREGRCADIASSARSVDWVSVLEVALGTNLVQSPATMGAGHPASGIIVLRWIRVRHRGIPCAGHAVGPDSLASFTSEVPRRPRRVDLDSLRPGASGQFASGSRGGGRYPKDGRNTVRRRREARAAGSGQVVRHAEPRRDAQGRLEVGRNRDPLVGLHQPALRS
jgi:hypothetical protein